MSDTRWMLEMIAEPIVPPWKISADCHVNAAELQRAIIKGFSREGDPVWGGSDHDFSFERTFTFDKDGEFFRGALTFAGLRYSGDFYELLKRYGTIRVTITKKVKEEK